MAHSVRMGNSDPQAVGLARVIRSSAVLIVLLALAGGALGALAATRVDQRASATTPVLVNPLEGNPFYPSQRGEDLVNLGSEAESLRSEAVATKVVEDTGTDLTTTELLRRVTVGVPPNTQILEVTYSDRDPADALRFSQAFAEAYLRTREERAQQRIDEQAVRIDEQIASINGELETLAAQLATQPAGSASATITEQRMTALASQLNTLTTRRGELDTGVLDPGQIVTPAALDPEGPVDLRIALPLLGALLGAVGGGLIGVLRSRTDTRLHHPDAVTAAGVRVIGSIGWTDPDAATPALDPAIAAEDEYRRLRVAVLAQEKRRPLTLLVAATGSETHEPTTAVDLAISFARSGLDTTVVDVTSSGAGPSRVLAQFHPAGVSDVLLGNATLTDTLVPVAPLLWVLPPGREVQDVADLLTSDEMRRLLAVARDRADIVIVAAGSVQTGGAQSLASLVDAVLIETEQGRTTLSELRSAAHALGVLGTAFLGTVFIGRDAARRRDAFSPDTGLSQRQLPPPGTAQLPPAADQVGAAEPGTPRPAPPAPPAHGRSAPAGTTAPGTAAPPAPPPAPARAAAGAARAKSAPGRGPSKRDGGGATGPSGAPDRPR